jgi:hypothetical protein
MQMQYDFETRSDSMEHRHFRCPCCQQNTFVGNTIPLDGLNETHASALVDGVWHPCPYIGKLEEVLK